MRRLRNLVAVLALPLLLLAAVPGTAAQAKGRGGEAQPGDWTTWQKDLLGSRHNPDEFLINPRTVGKLKLKWAYTYATVPGTRNGSQPAVIGDSLYVGAPDGKMISLNRWTGATKWVFDLSTVVGPINETAQDMVRDGPAVKDGKVYFGDSRGTVFALNQYTGALIWATQVDPHQAAWITSSPLIYKGRVYIGVSSNESALAGNPNYPCCNHNGQMVSLDAATGKVLWRYRTTPPAQALGTWPSGATKYGPGGAAVWSSPVVDPATDLLYFGTGNNYTSTGGDVDSVIAVNALTGSVRWKFKATADDVYTVACARPDLIAAGYCPSRAAGTALDFDFGGSANIIKKDGRTLVTIGQKGGMFWAFDARTGAVVWSKRLAEPNLNDPDPGAAGVEWGSAYDGRYLYAATWRPAPYGELFALDPLTGATAWSKPHPADACSTGEVAGNPACFLAFTPAVSTTPGLVFEGSWTGKMYAFSSRDGAKLWEFDAIRDYDGVNGIPGHGLAISGNGGAVISKGMVYVQAGYYPWTSDKGYVLLAFGL